MPEAGHLGDALQARLASLTNRPLSLAVSGGADSFALLALVYQMGRTDFDVQSVDHGLRPEAAAECQAVAAWCAARTIPHTIHQWKGKASRGNVMAAARTARYRMMADHAAARGADLVVAHQADDLAESLLMRMQRKAGLLGVNPLPPLRLLETQSGAQLRLLRPLLDVSRADLRVVAHGLPFSDDPSNDNADYQRIAVRRLLQADPSLRDALLQTAKRLSGLKQAMQFDLPIAELAAGDLVRLDRSALTALPHALRYEALANLIAGINRGAALPRGQRLARLCAALLEDGFSGASLAGLLFVPVEGGVLVGREARACAAPMALGASTKVWDRRYRVCGPVGISIAALGQAGLAQLRERGTDYSDVPPPLREGLAGLWRGRELIACPALEAVPDGGRCERTLWLKPASPPIALY